MAHPYAGQKGGSKLLGRYGGASKQAASKAIEASARNTSTPKIGVSDLTPDGKKSADRGDRFARGGKVPATTNVIISMPSKDPAPMPIMPPPVAAAPPPMAPPQPMPLGGGMGGPPPGLKFGGRFKKGGAVKASPFEVGGPAAERGVAKVSNPSGKMGGDKASDKKRLANILGVKRAMGGKVPHMTAGAGSGEGREEKIGLQKRAK